MAALLQDSVEPPPFFAGHHYHHHHNPHQNRQQPQPQHHQHHRRPPSPSSSGFGAQRQRHAFQSFQPSSIAASSGPSSPVDANNFAIPPAGPQRYAEPVAVYYPSGQAATAAAVAAVAAASAASPLSMAGSFSPLLPLRSTLRSPTAREDERELELRLQRRKANWGSLECSWLVRNAFAAWRLLRRWPLEAVFAENASPPQPPSSQSDWQVGELQEELQELHDRLVAKEHLVEQLEQRLSFLPTEAELQRRRRVDAFRVAARLEAAFEERESFLLLTWGFSCFQSLVEVARARAEASSSLQQQRELLTAVVPRLEEQLSLFSEELGDCRRRAEGAEERERMLAVENHRLKATTHSIASENRLLQAEVLSLRRKERCLLTEAFSAWQHYRRGRKDAARTLVAMMNRDRHLLISAMLSAWGKVVREKADTLRHVNGVSTGECRAIVKVVIHRWCLQCSKARQHSLRERAVSRWVENDMYALAHLTLFKWHQVSLRAREARYRGDILARGHNYQLVRRGLDLKYHWRAEAEALVVFFYWKHYLQILKCREVADMVCEEALGSVHRRGLELVDWHVQRGCWRMLVAEVFYAWVQHLLWLRQQTHKEEQAMNTEQHRSRYLALGTKAALALGQRDDRLCLEVIVAAWRGVILDARWSQSRRDLEREIFASAFDIVGWQASKDSARALLLQCLTSWSQRTKRVLRRRHIQDSLSAADLTLLRPLLTEWQRCCYHRLQELCQESWLRSETLLQRWALAALRHACRISKVEREEQDKNRRMRDGVRGCVLRAATALEGSSRRTLMGGTFGLWKEVSLSSCAERAGSEANALWETLHARGHGLTSFLQRRFLQMLLAASFDSWKEFARAKRTARQASLRLADRCGGLLQQELFSEWRHLTLLERHIFAAECREGEADRQLERRSLLLMDFHNRRGRAHLLLSQSLKGWERWMGRIGYARRVSFSLCTHQRGILLHGALLGWSQSVTLHKQLEASRRFEIQVGVKQRQLHAVLGLASQRGKLRLVWQRWHLLRQNRACSMRAIAALGRHSGTTLSTIILAAWRDIVRSTWQHREEEASAARRRQATLLARRHHEIFLTLQGNCLLQALVGHWHIAARHEKWARSCHSAASSLADAQSKLVELKLRRRHTASGVAGWMLSRAASTERLRLLRWAFWQMRQSFQEAKLSASLIDAESLAERQLRGYFQAQSGERAIAKAELREARLLAAVLKAWWRAVRHLQHRSELKRRNLVMAGTLIGQGSRELLAAVIWAWIQVRQESVGCLWREQALAMQSRLDRRSAAFATTFAMGAASARTLLWQLWGAWRGSVRSIKVVRRSACTLIARNDRGLELAALKCWRHEVDQSRQEMRHYGSRQNFLHQLHVRGVRLLDFAEGSSLNGSASGNGWRLLGASLAAWRFLARGWRLQRKTAAAMLQSSARSRLFGALRGWQRAAGIARGPTFEPGHAVARRALRADPGQLFLARGSSRFALYKSWSVWRQFSTHMAASRKLAYRLVDKSRQAQLCVLWSAWWHRLESSKRSSARRVQEDLSQRTASSYLARAVGAWQAAAWAAWRRYVAKRHMTSRYSSAFGRLQEAARIQQHLLSWHVQAAAQAHRRRQQEMAKLVAESSQQLVEAGRCDLLRRRREANRSRLAAKAVAKCINLDRFSTRKLAFAHWRQLVAEDQVASQQRQEAHERRQQELQELQQTPSRPSPWGGGAPRRSTMLQRQGAAATPAAAGAGVGLGPLGLEFGTTTATGAREGDVRGLDLGGLTASLGDSATSSRSPQRQQQQHPHPHHRAPLTVSEPIVQQGTSQVAVPVPQALTTTPTPAGPAPEPGLAAAAVAAAPVRRVEFQVATGCNNNNSSDINNSHSRETHHATTRSSSHPPPTMTNPGSRGMLARPIFWSLSGQVTTSPNRSSSSPPPPPGQGSPSRSPPPLATATATEPVAPRSPSQEVPRRSFWR